MGQNICLYGVDSLPADSLLVQLLSVEQMADDKQASPDYPPDIAVILEEFQSLFQAPTQLPPTRICDHTIPLVEGAEEIERRGEIYPLAVRCASVPRVFNPEWCRSPTPVRYVRSEFFSLCRIIHFEPVAFACLFFTQLLSALSVAKSIPQAYVNVTKKRRVLVNFELLRNIFTYRKILSNGQCNKKK